MMILVIDVGNTHTVIGVYKEEKLLGHWRISTDLNKTEDEYGMLVKSLLSDSNLSFPDIKSTVISCVVPPVTWILKKMSVDYFKVSPIIVGPGIKTEIYIKTDNPKEVGADRIVNAVAAYEMHKKSLIIIDFGTATTFCAIAKNGDYLGGTICPGIKISSEALFERAAKLPRVELVKPDTVLCKNTISSMQAGIIYGYIGQVDYIVNKMKLEMNAKGEDDIMVIATGGLAKLIAKDSQTIDRVEPFLTLEGLRIIYQKNKE